MKTRMDQDKRLALTLLQGQSMGYGTVAASAQAAALLAEWETLGWTESHVDGDGDRVYMLTFAGKAALVDLAKDAPS